RIYEIDEAKSVVSGQSSVAAPGQLLTTNYGPRTTNNASTLFSDVSDLLQHVHHDDAFDDFARQPLLSRRLSTLGPGLAWFDFDADGWDDLVIGAGRGGRTAVYRNDAHGGFVPLTNAPLSRPVGRDQTGVVGMDPLLLIGSAN